MLQWGHREAAAQRAREVLGIPRDDPAWPPALTARITLGVAIAHEEPGEAAEHLRQALSLARDDGPLQEMAVGHDVAGIRVPRKGSGRPDC